MKVTERPGPQCFPEERQHSEENTSSSNKDEHRHRRFLAQSDGMWCVTRRLCSARPAPPPWSIQQVQTSSVDAHLLECIWLNAEQSSLASDGVPVLAARRPRDRALVELQPGSRRFIRSSKVKQTDTRPRRYRNGLDLIENIGFCMLTNEARSISQGAPLSAHVDRGPAACSSHLRCRSRRRRKSGP